VERTLLIIKPDAVERKLIGYIVDRLEKDGFNLLNIDMVHLSRQRAEAFYAVHKEKPFYGDLVEYMTSGRVVPLLLEKESAVADLRRLIGDTDPSKAADGTIRREIAIDKQKNSVHASDSVENAKIEIVFFFD
jgi:nucleoside-diphosphate kinase